MDSLEKLREQHSHRIPDEKAVKLLRRIRQDFLNISTMIEQLLPPGREKALVQTKLDEARMWACNAAVAGGEIREQLAINRTTLD